MMKAWIKMNPKECVNILNFDEIGTDPATFACGLLSLENDESLKILESRLKKGENYGNRK